MTTAPTVDWLVTVTFPDGEQVGIRLAAARAYWAEYAARHLFPQALSVRACEAVPCSVCGADALDAT